MPTQSIEELIAAMPTFAGLPPEQLATVAGCGRTCGFEAGAEIAREGGAADTFYAIRSGRVALDVAAPGPGALTIGTLGAGEVLGWSWLFPPYRWSFDARALDPVRAIEFDGACLRGKCEADKELGYELMRRFAAIILERLQSTRVQLLDVYGGGGG
ncbi:MAG: cyclic nucleotide-binding domain-containing protein [Solirubrobacterales bacterium]